MIWESLPLRYIVNNKITRFDCIYTNPLNRFICGVGMNKRDRYIITGASLLLKMSTLTPKNGDLPELCYPVHGVRERVNRVLDVGIHAVFLAAVVPRGPNTHSAVWVGHLV